MKTLEELFLDELADIYDAETRLSEALPKLAEAAENENLREAIESHYQETQRQADRLQQVFRAFGKTAKGKKCKAIVGLLKEADDIVADNEGSPTIDAALISAAQKVEHYEIASYGCLREWAELLGKTDAASTLEAILNEEKAADARLTDLARECCNIAAEQDEDTMPSPGRGIRPVQAHMRRDDSD